MSAGPAPNRPVLLLCGLALLIVVAHLPLRHAEYVQDDELAVERNRVVEHGGIEEIFSTSYWEGARGADRTLFRPIVIGSYALERRLTGEPDAAVSHALNVALHVLVTGLLLLLAQALLLPVRATVAAAALFAVHPIHVEAVANVVGRAELLAALFSLAALYAITRTADQAGRVARHPRIAAWAAGVLLFLALGSKEIAIATPFLMVALIGLFATREQWRDPRWFIDRAAALAPSLLAGLVYLGLRVHALEALVSVQQVHPLDNPLVGLAGEQRLATALGLVARYAELLFYPLHLANDYSGSVIAVETGLGRPLPLIGLLLLVACLAPVALAVRRIAGGPAAAAPVLPALRSRQTAFAALLFLLPYAVIGNLFFIVGAGLAERFMYLPSAGFCLLLGLGLAWLSTALDPRLAGRAFAAIVALFLAAFTLQTFARCLEWRDNRTVFEAAVRVNPQSPRAHFVLGKLALDSGDPAGAIAHLDRVLALRPDHPTAWLEKGNAYADQGRFAAAEHMFRETVRLAPTYATAHRNHALALRRLRRLGDAERALRKAALWQPESATTWAEIGNLNLQLRRFDEAASAYRRAIELGRDDLGPRLALAEQGGAANE